MSGYVQITVAQAQALADMTANRDCPARVFASEPVPSNLAVELLVRPGVCEPRWIRPDGTVS